MSEALIHPDAEVSPDATLGRGTKIWGHAQVRERAIVGVDCIVGRGAYLDAGVRVGSRVKIQNLAQLYHPAVLADDVFVGPGVILTNDPHPRATTPGGALATAEDWTAVGVTVEQGASLGAGSVCVAPVTIGRYALVGAGSVVIDDVPAYALVVGNPARQVGWVGPAGQRLVSTDGVHWQCPITDQRFVLTNDTLVPME